MTNESTDFCKETPALSYSFSAKKLKGVGFSSKYSGRLTSISVNFEESEAAAKEDFWDSAR